MFKYHCLNPIADIGLTQFSDEYVAIDKMENVDAVLVRSAAMHDLEFDEDLKVIARAGAGVNNIPLDKCAEKGIVRKEDRSLMNVPFVTGDKELDAKFVKEAKAAGFENLKGHRSVGGMRASIYNAMPIEGVKALVAFMKKFEEENM